MSDLQCSQTLLVDTQRQNLCCKCVGLMTSQEKELYLNTINSKDSNWWIPFHWAYTLLFRAKQEGKLPEGLSRLQDVINLVEKICIRVFASVEQTTFKDILDLRNKCWVLFSHDWIPIPMVYTQVDYLYKKQNLQLTVILH